MKISENDSTVSMLLFGKNLNYGMRGKFHPLLHTQVLSDGYEAALSANFVYFLLSKTYVQITGAKPALGPNCMIPYKDSLYMVSYSSDPKRA